jgi:hypothetical protein
MFGPALTRAHVVGRDREDFLDMSTWRAAYTAERWRDILRIGIEEESMQERLRLATLTGRPFGSGQFIKELELASNRELRLKPAGRKRTGKEVADQSLLTIGV